MHDLWTSLLQWLTQLAPALQHTGDAISTAGHAAGGAVAPVLQRMDMPTMLALAGALGWASGFRLYAAVFLVGMMGLAGWLPLPPSMHVLQHPAVLSAAGLMLLVEFFADKIPALDSLWDLANSVIRIPGGALLAGSVFGLDGGVMTVVAALLGGTLAATAQAANTTTRAAINTSPEPFSNIALSFAQDGLVVAIVWLAVQHPFIFAVVLLIACVLMVWVTWLLLRFLKAALRQLRTWLGQTAPVQT